MRTINERKCYRCGKCCQDITLTISPEEIKARGDIDLTHLIFIYEKPIKYFGRIHDPAFRYHYRCTRFIPHEDGTGRCAIHRQSKPLMCIMFPYPPYKYATEFVRKEYLVKVNYPSHYQGCGYNRDDENPTDERQE